MSESIWQGFTLDWEHLPHRISSLDVGVDVTGPSKPVAGLGRDGDLGKFAVMHNRAPILGRAVLTGRALETTPGPNGFSASIGTGLPDGPHTTGALSVCHTGVLDPSRVVAVLDGIRWRVRYPHKKSGLLVPGGIWPTLLKVTVDAVLVSGEWHVQGRFDVTHSDAPDPIKDVGASLRIHDVELRVAWVATDAPEHWTHRTSRQLRDRWTKDGHGLPTPQPGVVIPSGGSSGHGLTGFGFELDRTVKKPGRYLKTWSFSATRGADGAVVGHAGLASPSTVNSTPVDAWLKIVSWPEAPAMPTMIARFDVEGLKHKT